MLCYVLLIYDIFNLNYVIYVISNLNYVIHNLNYFNFNFNFTLSNPVCSLYTTEYCDSNVNLVKFTIAKSHNQIIHFLE